MLGLWNFCAGKGVWYFLRIFIFTPKWKTERGGALLKWINSTVGWWGSYFLTISIMSLTHLHQLCLLFFITNGGFFFTLELIIYSIWEWWKKKNYIYIYICFPVDKAIPYSGFYLDLKNTDEKEKTRKKKIGRNSHHFLPCLVKGRCC